MIQARRFVPVLGLMSLAAAAAAHAVPLQGQAIASGGRFGASVAALEDQNGDGRWELLVGAPEVDASGVDNGRAYLWFGGLGLPLSANLIMTGLPGERFGHAVARVGDVNNDGHPDFAVGAPGYSQGGTNRGRVYIFFGGPGLDATPDVILESPSTTSQFGYAIAAAGDFNGDGIDDLIVGAPFGDLNGLDAGEAYLFYGSSSTSALAASDLTLVGLLPRDRFGWSAHGAGNFFRDGRAAVVVGAPANDPTITRPGKAYVYRGSSSPSPGPDATPDLILASASVNPAASWFGFSVRGIGDWSGDGTPDIAVGAPRDQVAGPQAGRVEIFFGGASADSIGDCSVRGALQGDHFGYALDGVGNVVGGALPDLLIGAPYNDASGSNAGRAYLWAGGGTSHDSAASLTAVPALGAGGALADDEFGFWVASAGDFDGDGQPDYAVGAPNGNIYNGSAAGYVQVYDSSGGVVATEMSGWQAAWTPTGAVRLEFTLQARPSEVARLALWRQMLPPGAAQGELALVCSGDPGDGTMPLVIRDDVWVLLDRLPPPPPEMSLRYALEIETHAGQQYRLDNLPGPPAGGPPAAPLELRQPYPNPFNPRTVIPFMAPAGLQVVCRIVDLRGRQVETLFAGTATGSLQSVAWDGRASGRPVPAGVYAVQLIAGERLLSQRIVLAK